jgi:hypothetical protein
MRCLAVVCGSFLFAPNGALFCLAHSATVGQGYDFYWSPEGAVFVLAYNALIGVMNLYYNYGPVSVTNALRR